MISKSAKIKLTIFLSIFLFLNIVALLISLWCSLFGPSLGLLGVIGFVLGGLGLGVSRAFGKKILSDIPNGLSSVCPSLRFFRRPSLSFFNFFVVMAGIGFFVCFITSITGGVGDTPVFKERPSYQFNDHGKITEVSRLRYILSGTGFSVGWHCGALFLSWTSLHYWLFGERKGFLEESKGKDKKQETKKTLQQ